MKYLAICIPNYNRLEKLKRLIEKCVVQIIHSSLERDVEICISDDCSTEDPTEVIISMQRKYPSILFRYQRNEKNEGMDYNFLNSVLLSDSLYCWIVGNDDVPEENGICRAVKHLKEEKDRTDILITPFNVYAENDEYRSTIYPFGDMGGDTLRYDTSNVQEYRELLNGVQHNSALFGFLSNVIFKRCSWERYKERFQDKLDTIFIQMYMNIQTLQDGAVVDVVPWKVIKNYSDDEMNQSITRISKILLGLDGVVEYFFSGEEKQYLKRRIVDPYITGEVWDLPEEHLYKNKIRGIASHKNRLYETYYVPPEERESFFSEKNVLIYGAGIFGKKVYGELKKYGAVLKGIADSDEAKKGMRFEEFAVMSVKDMLEVCGKWDTCIIVASHMGVEAMINTLIENKIEKIALIS